MQNYKYKSDDEGIVTVDSNGNVTAVSIGEAIVAKRDMNGEVVRKNHYIITDKPLDKIRSSMLKKYTLIEEDTENEIEKQFRQYQLIKNVKNHMIEFALNKRITGWITGESLQKVVLELENESGKPVVANLPIGLYFRAKKKSVQDMVLLYDTEVRFEENERRKTLIADVACMNVRKSAPQSRDLFYLDFLNKESLLLKFVKDLDKRANRRETQIKIWYLLEFGEEFNDTRANIRELERIVRTNDSFNEQVKDETIKYLKTEDAPLVFEKLVSGFVVIQPESVKILDIPLVIWIDEPPVTLQAKILPVNAVNKAICWTSNNTDVVDINRKTGTLIANGIGRAVITATTKDGGKTDSCEVSVLQNSGKITNIMLSYGGKDFIDRYTNEDCPIFMKILKGIFHDDESLIYAIQEVMGYCVLAYNEHPQKWFMFVGEDKNGKNIICDIIKKLANMETCSPQRYRNPFDSYDLREITHAQDKSSAVFSMSALPEFSDSIIDYVIDQRLVVIPFNSPVNNPSISQTENLLKEVKGICNFALDGFERLRKNEWRFSCEPMLSKVVRKTPL